MQSEHEFCTLLEENLLENRSDAKDLQPLSRKSLIFLVAGAGFEPATSGL
jgi:hypothetical protein